MSGLIPRTFIDELLARADIVEVVDSRVSLKKAGTNYTACCPFHNEKTPSLVVSPAKQIYHCFGCGAGGNSISFIMAFDRLDFVPAIEALATQLGLEVPREAAATRQPAKSMQPDLYHLLEQVNKFYQEQLRLSPVAVDYLKQRQVTGQIAKQFGIGYAPAGWNALSQHFKHDPVIHEQLLQAGMLIKKADGGYYDRFRDRIMFPIRDRRGRMIGFGGRIINEGNPKYLNSPETAIFHKGRELYGLYEALQTNRDLPQVLVVEGYMDVVMLAQHGVPFGVATLGTATSVEHIKSLNKLTKEIIFCFDGDAAGKAAAWRAFETVLPVIQDNVQIKFLLLPEGEDPDSLIQKEGELGFNDRLEQAMTLSDFLFSQLMAKINISTLDGKAHFAKLAGDYLKKIPECIFKQMLFDRLAQLVRMDEVKLRLMIGDSKTPANERTTQPRKLLNISPMRLVMALLIQNPVLLEELRSERPWLMALQLPGSDLLRSIITVLEALTQATTATLLEHWRDKPDYNLISKLAFWEHAIPEQGLKAEFNGAVCRLKQLNHEHIIEQLMLKAQHEGLSNAEKQRLQQLITEQKH